MVEPFSIEEIKKYLKDEFGIELPRGKIFAEGKRVFLYTGKDLGLGGRYGIYIGNIENGFRPSTYVIELATKGFTEVSEKEAMEWMCGLDIKKDAEGFYTIIKFGKYKLGVGKPKEGRIINNLPKNRRLPLSKMK
jgi:NOL1/NOP2/fmu family ribosome biogenesis protein